MACSVGQTFGLANQVNRKKKQVGLVDGFAKLLNGTIGLLNFWFDLVGLVG